MLVKLDMLNETTQNFVKELVAEHNKETNTNIHFNSINFNNALNDYVENLKNYIGDDKYQMVTRWLNNYLNDKEISETLKDTDFETSSEELVYHIALGDMRVYANYSVYVEEHHSHKNKEELLDLLKNGEYETLTHLKNGKIVQWNA